MEKVLSLHESDIRYLHNLHIINAFIITATYHTCGCSALKGGIPTMSSNRITPTDHQSAVAPEKKHESRMKDEHG